MQSIYMYMYMYKCVATVCLHIMQVSGLDVVEVPVHYSVSGCPLIFHSTALPQHTLIRWGTPSNDFLYYFYMVFVYAYMYM